MSKKRRKCVIVSLKPKRELLFSRAAPGEAWMIGHRVFEFRKHRVDAAWEKFLWTSAERTLETHAGFSGQRFERQIFAYSSISGKFCIQPNHNAYVDTNQSVPTAWVALHVNWRKKGIFITFCDLCQSSFCCVINKPQDVALSCFRQDFLLFSLRCGEHFPSSISVKKMRNIFAENITLCKHLVLDIIFSRSPASLCV